MATNLIIKVTQEEAGLVVIDGGLQIAGRLFCFLMARDGVAWFSGAAAAKRSALLLLMRRCRLHQLFQSNIKTSMF